MYFQHTKGKINFLGKLLYVKRYNEVSGSRAYRLRWFKIVKEVIDVSLPHEKKLWKCLFTLKQKSKCTFRRASIHPKLDIDKNCWRSRKLPQYNAVYLKRRYFTNPLLWWVIFWVLKQRDSASNIFLITSLVDV